LQPFSAEAASLTSNGGLPSPGGGAKELFEAERLAMIYQHTGGAARLINVLCDAALHAACLRASGHVGAGRNIGRHPGSRWPEAVARDKANPAPAEKERPPRPPQSNAPAAHAQLLVSHRAEHIAAWPLRPGRISIGRAADNEVQLEARYVSRHHCQVVTVGDVSTIEDLGSVNGMSVNGKVVKTPRLAARGSNRARRARADVRGELSSARGCGNFSSRGQVHQPLIHRR